VVGLLQPREGPVSIHSPFLIAIPYGHPDPSLEDDLDGAGCRWAIGQQSARLAS
jgi:hypothetical protein